MCEFELRCRREKWERRTIKVYLGTTYRIRISLKGGINDSYTPIEPSQRKRTSTLSLYSSGDMRKVSPRRRFYRVPIWQLWQGVDSQILSSSKRNALFACQCYSSSLLMDTFLSLSLYLHVRSIVCRDGTFFVPLSRMNSTCCFANRHDRTRSWA